jgi:hypothetical protein
MRGLKEAVMHKFTALLGGGFFGLCKPYVANALPSLAPNSRLHAI